MGNATDAWKVVIVVEAAIKDGSELENVTRADESCDGK